MRRHDTELLFLEDDPDLRDANSVVDAEALLGATTIETSRRPTVHWVTSLMIMCLCDLLCSGQAQVVPRSLQGWEPVLANFE
jgi:hypothetical protein